MDNNLTNQKIDFCCPVCNSIKLKEKFADSLGDNLPTFNYDFSKNLRDTYRIVKCLECTHHFATPRHKNLYLNYDSTQIDQIYLDLQHQRIATDHKVIKEILKYVRSGKLLDIGCATADFLSIAQNYYDVEGLELSAWSSKIAAEKGLLIHKCLLKDMGARQHYDIITLWGVIEHFEYPKDEIAHISRLLKKDGLVFLWTGDISSITAKIFGRKWWYFQGQHIQLFTKKSLNKLFADNGFIEVACNKYPYTLTMQSLSNSLKRYPVFNILQPIIQHKSLRNVTLTVKLPGEIFSAYRKTASAILTS
jgi:hypothetical protein